MIVRPLAGYHCTCALINWMVLLHLTRPSMHAWVTSERYHDSMGSKGKGTKASLMAEEQGCRNKDFASVARARGEPST